MIDTREPTRESLVNRRTLNAMATFCSDQRRHFDPAAWLRCSISERKVVGVVAQYLAMTSWYGHDTELQSIAEKFYPGISNTNTFTSETQAMGLNLAQFSVSTRFGPHV